MSDWALNTWAATHTHEDGRTYVGRAEYCRGHSTKEKKA